MDEEAAVQAWREKYEALCAHVMSGEDMKQARDARHVVERAERKERRRLLAALRARLGRPLRADDVQALLGVDEAQARRWLKDVNIAEREARGERRRRLLDLHARLREQGRALRVEDVQALFGADETQARRWLKDYARHQMWLRSRGLRLAGAEEGRELRER